MRDPDGITVELLDSLTRRQIRFAQTLTRLRGRMGGARAAREEIVGLSTRKEPHGQA